MKKYLAMVFMLTGLMGVAAVFAAESLDAQIERCFQAHAHLMDKPALKNRIACWRAHGYLMDRA